jgi:hypothetical protein
MIVGSSGLAPLGAHAALDICRVGFDMVVFDLHPPAADPLVQKAALRGFPSSRCSRLQ